MLENVGNMNFTKDYLLFLHFQQKNFANSHSFVQYGQLCINIRIFIDKHNLSAIIPNNPLLRDIVRRENYEKGLSYYVCRVNARQYERMFRRR